VDGFPVADCSAVDGEYAPIESAYLSGFDVIQHVDREENRFVTYSVYYSRLTITRNEKVLRCYVDTAELQRRCLWSAPCVQV